MVFYRFIGVILVGIATFSVAAPAAAQAEEKPFEGPYAGVAVGYDVQGSDPGSRVDFDRNLDGVFGDPVPTATNQDDFSPGVCDGRARGRAPLDGCRNDRDGVSYYGRVGYDKQYGSIVVGVVGEFGKTNVLDAVSAFSLAPESYTFIRKVDWEASARLRVGYAARTTLFYATGGAGYANIKNSFQTTNQVNAFSDSGNDQDWGYVVGGGIEQKITRNVSIGVEYTYHDYKDDGYRVNATRGLAAVDNPFVLAPNTTGTDLRRSDDRFQWHSVRAVALFRF